jgi:ATP-dependent Clp protease adapter protein ClpS
VKEKEFVVFINEVKQNFVFGDRLIDSYTKTVTMSDGSTRTIKLTPMIHNGSQVVELNDSGHISYMGLDGTTTNGTLMVQLHEIPEALRGKLPAQGVVPAVDPELLYPDEHSCAASILSAEAVQNLYKALGTDPEIIKTRLRNLKGDNENPDSLEFLKQRALAGIVVPVPLELSLLSALLIHGTWAVKQALTPREGKPGDVLFFVVHRRPEAELQSLWPGPDDQTGNVLLTDDPYTSMESVVSILRASFGLEVGPARQKMLEVHKSGFSVLELDPGSNVSDACMRLNSEWRSVGLPLYCEPQRLP